MSILPAYNENNTTSDPQFFRDVLRAEARKRQGVLPAIVKSYDRSTGIATVLPLIKSIYLNQKAETEYVDLLAVSVPVKREIHGGFMIDAPIFQGDTGWLIAGDRENRDARYFNSSILTKDDTSGDYNRGPVPPMDYSLQEFANGFFIPDCWGQTNLTNNDGVVIKALSKIFLGSDVENGVELSTQNTDTESTSTTAIATMGWVNDKFSRKGQYLTIDTDQTVESNKTFAKDNKIAFAPTVPTKDSIFGLPDGVKIGYGRDTEADHTDARHFLISTDTDSATAPGALHFCLDYRSQKYNVLVGERCITTSLVSKSSYVGLQLYGEEQSENDPKNDTTDIYGNEAYLIANRGWVNRNFMRSGNYVTTSSAQSITGTKTFTQAINQTASLPSPTNTSTSATSVSTTGWAKKYFVLKNDSVQEFAENLDLPWEKGYDVGLIISVIVGLELNSDGSIKTIKKRNLKFDSQGLLISCETVS